MTSSWKTLWICADICGKWLSTCSNCSEKKKRHHRSSLFTHFSRLFSFAGCLFSACNDTSYGHKDICVVHACVYRGGVRVHVRVWERKRKTEMRFSKINLICLEGFGDVKCEIDTYMYMSYFCLSLLLHTSFNSFIDGKFPFQIGSIIRFLSIWIHSNKTMLIYL